MKKQILIAILFASTVAGASLVTLKQIDNIQNSSGGPQISVPSNGSVFLTDFNLGTTANKALQLNGSGAVPAVDGFLLSNINAAKIKGVAVSAVAPTDGQVLMYNSSSAQWEPSNDGDSAGTVTSVASGSGLLGGPITSTGTLSVDSGTGANQIVKLDGSAALPAVDGFALTNLNAAKRDLSNLVSTAVNADIDPASNDVLLLGKNNHRYNTGYIHLIKDSSSVQSADFQLRTLNNTAGVTTVDYQGKVLYAAGPSGSVDWENRNLLNAGVTRLSWNAAFIDIFKPLRIQGSTSGFVGLTVPATSGSTIFTLPSADGTAGQVLTTNGGAILSFSSAGTVNSVASGTGLLGGPITSSGTLSVDVGTAMNQIVQLDGSARLPAVDGSQLTNLPVNAINELTGDVLAGPGTGAQAASVIALQGYAISAAAPADGQVLTYNNSTSMWEGHDSAADAGDFLQNGNSFSALAVLGTNDNFGLKFKTNNIVAQTIDTSQRVGIGSASPDSRVMISNNAAASVPGTLTSGSILHVVGADANPVRIVVDSFGTAPNSAGLTLRHARGTAASPTASQNGDLLGGIFSAGYGATDYTAGRASIQMFAAEAYSATNQGAYMSFLTTPKTTIVPAEAMRINDVGMVGIGTTSPVAKMDVHGSSGATLKIVDSNQAVSNVLQSDANGVASWVASLADAASLLSVDYKNRVLVSSSAQTIVDYDNAVLNDTAGNLAIQVNQRKLYANDGSTDLLDFDDPSLIKANVKISFVAGGTTSLVGPSSGGAAFELPAADGTNGQFLKTDGSGVLSFATPGAPSLNGGSGSPQSVDPTPGVQLSNQSYVNKAWVVGNAGPVVVTNTPNVTPGNNDGEELIIIGTSDTNTVKLQDQGNLPGSGLSINGDVTLLKDESITLHWDNAQTLWVEDSRSY